MRPNSVVAPAIRWLAVLGALGIAIALQLRLGLTPDVSWLLTVAERVLEGETLYRDIIEYNPPFSVWLYMPAALTSRLMPIATETALYGFFVILLAASFSVCAALLVRCGAVHRERLWLMAFVWIALFVVLPLQTFLQREHLAVVALMPWLSLQVWRYRSRRGRPYTWAILLAGFSCAVLVATKPYFVTTILAPVLLLALRERSIRPFFHAENWIGAGLCAAYGMVVIWGYPEFLTLYAGTLKVAYLPVRTPEATLYFGICAALIALALILLRHPARWPAATSIPAAAATGHLAGVAIMGKAFTYHVLPGFILLLLALAALITAGPRPPVAKGLRLARDAAAAFAACVAIYLVAMVYLSGETPDRDLVAYLRANHPGGTFVSLSPSFADSHPLVRLAGGRYAGPHGAMLAQSYGRILLDQQPDLPLKRREALQAAIAFERDLFAEAILDKRPEVLLVSLRYDEASEKMWSAVASTADGGTTIENLYRRETQIGDIAVFARVARHAASP